MHVNLYLYGNKLLLLNVKFERNAYKVQVFMGEPMVPSHKGLSWTPGNIRTNGHGVCLLQIGCKSGMTEHNKQTVQILMTDH